MMLSPLLHIQDVFITSQVMLIKAHSHTDTSLTRCWQREVVVEVGLEVVKIVASSGCNEDGFFPEAGWAIHSRNMPTSDPVVKSCCKVGVEKAMDASTVVNVVMSSCEIGMKRTRDKVKNVIN